MATVFVVGAGPAGMFAAQKLALAGHETIILNRDIKPGGLAEYVKVQGRRVLPLPALQLSAHAQLTSVSLALSSVP